MYNKIQNYDKLQADYLQLQLDFKKNLASLTRELGKSYNHIEKPDLNLKEIESTLKLWDKFTLNQIISYLKLDSFEMVKNIAWTVNKENASEVIAYRDWALQRNESLIKFLSKFKSAEKNKIDRIKGEPIKKK